MLAYRAAFAEAWRDYLQHRFESPEDVASFYAVEASTARKWWGGHHAPSGFAVALAYRTDPLTAAEYLGAPQ